MDLANLSYDEALAHLRASPTTSFWLRNAVVALQGRDALDAQRDAEVLALLSRKRSDETLAHACESGNTASS